MSNANEAGKPLLSFFSFQLLGLTEVFFAAWPLADAALTQEILDLLQSAMHIRQAKKGANEGMF